MGRGKSASPGADDGGDASATQRGLEMKRAIGAVFWPALMLVTFAAYCAAILAPFWWPLVR